jgi:formate/nitrite transporter
MYLTSAFLSGRCRFRSVAFSLSLGWLGNFLGAVVCAYFLGYFPGLLSSDPQAAFVLAAASKKLSAGWGSVFLKGVGCNWLVCIAMWLQLACLDGVGKLLAIWLPIATFIWLGFEHSVANMSLLSLSLWMQGGSSGSTAGGTAVMYSFGDVLFSNLIPATFGNIVGGALFAAGQWLAYGTQTPAFMSEHRTLPNPPLHSDSEPSRR